MPAIVPPFMPPGLGEGEDVGPGVGHIVGEDVGHCVGNVGGGAMMAEPVAAPDTHTARALRGSGAQPACLSDAFPRHTQTMRACFNKGTRELNIDLL